MAEKIYDQLSKCEEYDGPSRDQLLEGLLVAMRVVEQYADTHNRDEFSPIIAQQCISQIAKELGANDA